MSVTEMVAALIHRARCGSMSSTEAMTARATTSQRSQGRKSLASAISTKPQVAVPSTTTAAMMRDHSSDRYDHSTDAPIATVPAIAGASATV